MSATALVWLRRDLRLTDNPALLTALARCEHVIPVYIHAPDEEAPWQPGAASRWWLHHSLRALDDALRERGSRLIVRRGGSLEILRSLLREAQATEIHWSRCYDPATVARDTKLKQALRSTGVDCHSHNSALLCEPWEVKTRASDPYRVFSPYWRRAKTHLTKIPAPRPAPDALPAVPSGLEALPIDSLGLLPRVRWDQGLRAAWRPGERGAQALLEAFLSGPIDDYVEARERPAQPGTSRLSPHLHFGEIGARQILAAIRASGRDDDAAEPYLRELGWREFSRQLLFHFPRMPLEPLNAKFEAFPWRQEGAESLWQAWRQGRTGIPIADAGMRELWHHGWMHNRVRMITASLLTKNLRLPWQEGARWFWDTLLDADLANNSQGWQWSAGCGADAAPYFRIFNPVLQGQRFDPQGTYVRRWCPELAGLPDTHIHRPWEAPHKALEKADVRLGKTYPEPIIDLKASREEALAAYEQITSEA